MEGLTNNIDETIKPQDDFFSYVNGKWLKNTMIPEDKSRLSQLSLIADKNILDIKSILESNEFNDDEFQKLRIFYNKGLNFDQRNNLDSKPIQKYLNAIQSIHSKNDLVEVLLLLSEHKLNPLFEIYSESDRKDTSQAIPHFESRGLSLPTYTRSNKVYYFDADKQEIRDKFIEYITELFHNINFPDASENARLVLRFETQLANMHLTQLQKRDPHLTYNSYESLKDLEKNYPNFNWQKYFRLFTNRNITKVVFDNLNYFNFINNLLQSPNIDEWKIYLTAKLLNSTAPYLSYRFVSANFNFYEKVINGIPKLKENFKITIETMNNKECIGELLGKFYVKKYFPNSSKDKMIDLVNNLLNTMSTRLSNLEWMSEKTKKRALGKLKNFKVKVGYPDAWEDFTKLVFKETDSYYEIVNKTYSFVQKQSLSDIYQTPNPNNWLVSPQTVNAYFHEYRNEIVFPAGILQYPVFNEQISDAENYGAVGVIISHEITHAFDDYGSQFDESGNLANWWSDIDAKYFKEKGKYLINEYNQFLVNGKPLNGELTLGENIADQGGVNIAFQALQLNYKKTGKREDDSELTSDEKFFYSYARLQCAKFRPEFLEMLRTTDPHSPPQARVNVTLSNNTEFQNIFKVKEGNKMFRKDIPIIW